METHVKTAKIVTDTQSNYSHIQKIYSSSHGLSRFCLKSYNYKVMTIYAHRFCVLGQLNITNIII